MSTLILVLCFYAAAIGLIVGLLLLVTGDSPSGGTIGLIVFAVASFIIYSMNQTDVQRHIVDTKERIGVVTQLTGEAVIVEDTNYRRILEFSDVKFDNIKIGDVVKVKFLDADFGNYVTKITPVEVKEKN